MYHYFNFIIRNIEHNTIIFRKDVDIPICWLKKIIHYLFKDHKCKKGDKNKLKFQRYKITFVTNTSNLIKKFVQKSLLSPYRSYSHLKKYLL